jgi:hypothetical protein
MKIPIFIPLAMKFSGMMKLNMVLMALLNAISAIENNPTNTSNRGIAIINHFTICTTISDFFEVFLEFRKSHQYVQIEPSTDMKVLNTHMV